MDIREGITIIKEHRGSAQVNRKELLLIFCNPVFVIIPAGWNFLTSLFNMEQVCLSLNY